jgi:hypothetical protein
MFEQMADMLQRLSSIDGAGSIARQAFGRNNPRIFLEFVKETMFNRSDQLLSMCLDFPHWSYQLARTQMECRFRFSLLAQWEMKGLCFISEGFWRINVEAIFVVWGMNRRGYPTVLNRTFGTAPSPFSL